MADYFLSLETVLKNAWVMDKFANHRIYLDEVRGLLGELSREENQ